MKKNFSSFTMAEILISLTIIGVIAAITLPSLRANINEKTWATQRKALYSRLSQAISMLPSLNGYGEYAGTWEDDVVTVEKDTAAARFVTDGLSKVLQINNICTIPMNTSSENARKELEKCGVSEKITNMANSKLDFPTKLSELNPQFTSNFVDTGNTTYQISSGFQKIDTVAAGFEMKNGESVAVFYNPYCRGDLKSIIKYDPDNINDTDISTKGYGVQPYMCANFIYDLNGKKGPNKVGKDIGYITALYPTDSEVVTADVTNIKVQGTYNQVNQLCRNADKEYRSANIEEIMSVFYNKNLVGIGVSKSFYYQSPNLASPYRAWTVTIHAGKIIDYLKENNHSVLCVKR